MATREAEHIIEIIGGKEVDAVKGDREDGISIRFKDGSIISFYSTDPDCCEIEWTIDMVDTDWAVHKKQY